MSPQRQSILVALTLVTVVALAGCSGARSDSGPRVEAVAIPDDISTLVYPLDSYRDYGHQSVLRKATYGLMQQCVQRFGFELPPDGKGGGKGRPVDRYGLANEKDARERGYELKTTPDEDLGVEMKIKPGTELFVVFHGRAADGTPAAANSGVPKGGCFAEAVAKLQAGSKRPEGPNLPSTLDREAWEKSRNDGRVVKATEAWRDCMRAVGYQYGNPVEEPFMQWQGKRMAANPNPTAEQKRNGIPVTKAEVDAALADVKCKRDSGLLQTWAEVDMAIQRQLIEKHSEQLRGYRELIENNVRNAQRITNSG
jgi:hypothetical protein